MSSPHFTSYLSVFRAVWQPESGNYAETLSALREAGASQLDSIRLLINQLGLSLSEADNIVLHSAAWADRLQGTLALREAFWNALDQDVTDEWDTEEG